MRYPISNTTESKFHDVQIKTLSQICDRSNRFLAISFQLTSNLFTSTVSIAVRNFHLKFNIQTLFLIFPTCLPKKDGIQYKWKRLSVSAPSRVVPSLLVSLPARPLRALTDRHTDRRIDRRTDGTDFIPSTADAGGKDSYFSISGPGSGRSFLKMTPLTCNLICIHTRKINFTTSHAYKKHLKWSKNW